MAIVFWVCFRWWLLRTRNGKAEGFFPHCRAQKLRIKSGVLDMERFFDAKGKIFQRCRRLGARGNSEIVAYVFDLLHLKVRI
jgi:hypothetical protein